MMHADYCAVCGSGEWKYEAIVDQNESTEKRCGLEKVDLMKRRSLSRRSCDSEDAFVLGHVGRFSYQKNMSIDP